MSDRARQKAIRMLEMLRVRTESRGATPAEAQQAAMMAERIIKRYGLSGTETAKSESIIEPGSKRLETWAYVLTIAIGKRFDVETSFRQQTGEKCSIRFRGAEHLVSVAKWLFMAIAKDLNKRSHIAGRTAGLKSAPFRSFKLTFKQSAAWEIEERLAPSEPAPLIEVTEEQRQQLAKEDNQRRQREKKRIAKMSQQQRMAELRKLERELEASEQGRLCGKELSIDTNAVGGKQLHHIEHQSS